MDQYSLRLCREHVSDYDVRFTGSSRVKELLTDYFKLREEPQESFYIFCLAADLSVVGFSRVSTGATLKVNVDIVCTLRYMLLSGCVSFIVCHNHPLGPSSPSEEDKQVTRRLKDAMTPFGLVLCDHMIVGCRDSLLNDDIFSFAENGLL